MVKAGLARLVLGKRRAWLLPLCWALRAPQASGMRDTGAAQGEGGLQRALWEKGG